jgi:hypothetical protein
VQFLVDALFDKIKKQEEELNNNQEVMWCFDRYLVDGGSKKEVIRWVEFIYEKHPDLAKKTVAYFHEEIMDLSVVPCCSKDFKPWTEEEREFEMVK